VKRQGGILALTDEQYEAIRRIGRALRRHRLAARITQGVAAERSGLNEKTISTFEIGTRTESLKVWQLLTLLRAYGVTPTAFFADPLLRTAEVRR
jgi:transcriptional regulator with XRE-family HTH domain